MSEPVRTCVGCGARKAQAALVRVALREGVWAADPERRLVGRGAYVCGAPCAEKALASRRLARAFKGRGGDATALVAAVRDAQERARRSQRRGPALRPFDAGSRTD